MLPHLRPDGLADREAEIERRVARVRMLREARPTRRPRPAAAARYAAGPELAVLPARQRGRREHLRVEAPDSRNGRVDLVPDLV